jgi:hypothetical protein
MQVTVVYKKEYPADPYFASVMDNCNLISYNGEIPNMYILFSRDGACAIGRVTLIQLFVNNEWQMASSVGFDDFHSIMESGYLITLRIDKYNTLTDNNSSNGFMSIDTAVMWFTKIFGSGK